MLDRTHRRFRRRVDLYMGLDVEGARQFGVKQLRVYWEVPMSPSFLDHPILLLPAALVVPFIAVTFAVLFAKGLGWVADDRRRGALVVMMLAVCYLGLALVALTTSTSPRAAIIYAVLGVLWAGLAWYNRMGPGSGNRWRRSVE